MTKARILALAVLLCAAPAFAQNAPGQEPPPKADPGTTVQASCIDENDHYARNGKQPMFVIELTNKCEQRITCKVFAYITSAKGTAQGRGTIVLAAKSAGAAAKNSYTFQARMNGGNSQSTRECKAI